MLNIDLDLQSRRLIPDKDTIKQVVLKADCYVEDLIQVKETSREKKNIFRPCFDQCEINFS